MLRNVLNINVGYSSNLKAKPKIALGSNPLPFISPNHFELSMIVQRMRVEGATIEGG